MPAGSDFTVVACPRLGIGQTEPRAWLLGHMSMYSRYREHREACLNSSVVSRVPYGIVLAFSILKIRQV